MTILLPGATGFIGSRVVLSLGKRQIPIVAADLDLDQNKSKLEKKYINSGFDKNLLTFEKLDITNEENITNLFSKYKFDCIINLAYGIGTICEENPLLASKINILGTTAIFEMVVKHKIRRLVFASSETVYGAKQSVFGNRPIKETDYTGINNHHFTYGVMKLLNEFMAEFGYGRQNTAINWAEDFAAKPALGEVANLPFSKDNVDNWIYVEDCAEQLIRLALKDKLNFSSFNSGSETLDGHKLEATVKKFIPDAQINFLNEKTFTPLIDDQDDSRIRKEIDFIPRTFAEGVKCLIDEVRSSNQK